MPGFWAKIMAAPGGVGRVWPQFLLGVATFFLPCGFTQSMQLYSLTTKSFFTGSLTMFLFALGTFPVLALFSFGFAGLYQRVNFGVVLKTAGLVVVFFAIFNLVNTMVALGVIPPIFIF